jgi:phosphoglycerate dehydrogenase-like enzyme
MRAFRVGLSHDLQDSGGSTSWGDIGLSELDEHGVAWEFLAPDDGTLTAGHVDGYDAVLFAAPAVTAATVRGHRPPALLARFGVGVDSVDLDACTKAGVAVTITPDGARRAVATAALTLILAVSHNLLAKDRLVREARWEAKLDLMGRGLTGRTVGSIGLGNVASELFRLLEPFATVNLAYDPYADPSVAARQGIRLAGLDVVLGESQVLVITAALTEETRHLIDASRLSLMRPGAIVVNVARGPIVDEPALVAALASGRLAGAGLDVFETEPLPRSSELVTMPNVVLAPHALAWTDEMALGNGRSAVRAILDVYSGRVPAMLANPAVAASPAFLARLTKEDLCQP